MTVGAWISVAAICALGAVSPGPSLLVIARHALRARALGVASALAHAVGVGLYALATVLGLAAILAAHPLVHQAVAVAGAAYLAVLGAASLRGGGASEGQIDLGTTARDRLAASRDGFAIALLNPKIAVFFLALFSQFVSPEAGIRDTAVLALTAMLIDGTWYVFVALVFSRSAVTGLRRRGRLLDRTTGVLLLAVAAWTFARALGAL